MLYASVVLELSVHKALDYAIPEHLATQVCRGTVVKVPLRQSVQRGFVVEVKNSSEVAHPKPLSAVLSAGPVVTEDLFTLALWMAKYYVCPLGKVLRTMLPAGVRKNTQLKTQYLVTRKKSAEALRSAIPELLQAAPAQALLLEAMLKVKGGLFLTALLEETGASSSSVKALAEKGYISLDMVRSDSTLLVNEEYFKTRPKLLREEQRAALDKIVSTIDKGQFEAHLLFGVTGSGKTEVYLQAIERALQLGKGVIMLVPEIALTPQTIQRFKSRFDVPISALHHRLSDGERLDAWQKIKEGTSPIVIGARSSIFSPVKNLGLIIVDEEHEQSYKQTEDALTYQARDVAIMRAKITSSCVVLGSATPSLESYHNACQGKYVLSSLKSRGSQTLPQVTIVDMRREYEKAKGITLFSDLLLKEIEQRKGRGEQTILFLNRRGYHTHIFCQACGKSVKCPHCDVTLTSHLKVTHVQCHLCGYENAPPRNCPHCHAQEVIQFRGIGTEKAEAMLHGIFPKLRTIRVDADTTRHKGNLERLLQQFRSGKADLLIGTQMVAKGLHFPEVTLVGILNCDATLNIPDFRSQEMVFQLITQVAGRSGRGHLPGTAIIQTALPEHPTILLAKEQDYEGFFKQEIETRKMFGFPPFLRIVKFLFTGKDEQKTRDYAEKYFDAMVASLPTHFSCHPLVPAGHAKIKDHFRFQFLVRGQAVGPCLTAIEQTEKRLPLPSSIAKYVDVDPTSTFY